MGEATILLGVSSATLRRWADAGRIATYTTPGGHRRFERAALLSLLPQRSHPSDEVGSRPADRRLGPGRAPRGPRVARPEGWLATVPDAAREPLRGHGLRITNALLTYLEAPQGEREVAMDVARQAATAYGWIAGSIGASMREAIETFQGFRIPFVREVAAAAGRQALDAAQTSALLVTATEAMDHLLEASMHGHEVARPRPRPRRAAGGGRDPRASGSR